MIADFRELKFTHNSIHVLDGIPGIRKLQCEVFSPVVLGHCGVLLQTSARQLCIVSGGYDAMMTSQIRVWLSGLSDENYLTQSIRSP